MYFLRNIVNMKSFILTLFIWISTSRFRSVVTCCMCCTLSAGKLLSGRKTLQAQSGPPPDAVTFPDSQSSTGCKQTQVSSLKQEAFWKGQSSSKLTRQASAGLRAAKSSSSVRGIVSVCCLIGLPKKYTLHTTVAQTCDIVITALSASLRSVQVCIS